MRSPGFLLALAGCGFEVAAAAPPLVDAPLARLCDADPALRLCFAFDQPSLPALLPNEGTAGVAASLTDITRIERSATSGAALFGATSAIHVPMHAEVSNILAFEIWFRIDTMPANTRRGGLVDSNASPTISLFFYRQDPVHTLRCGLGGQTEVFEAPLVISQWLYAACTCDGTSLAVYLNGVELGSRPGGCGSAGAIVGDGLTIGSDNTGNPSVVADRIIGAIDGVRLWSVGLTPAQICERSGRTDC